ncbi:WD-40 repeat-containing protein [Reticulomyxa filosa]|uniref:WD-40 repeat-containing protein n=1 Tax=Reticulomyxa filosa TaxID=46433 RepID=X6NMS4_RETFI|nr:WD-40 repeat-containing protein [Reticulomyxa filosa]|eukprot:ETO27560.1 WD-40 repeat-containing protein [Reticulomyxa filosa]
MANWRAKNAEDFNESKRYKRRRVHGSSSLNYYSQQRQTKDRRKRYHYFGFEENENARIYNPSQNNHRSFYQRDFDAYQHTSNFRGNKKWSNNNYKYYGRVYNSRNFNQMQSHNYQNNRHYQVQFTQTMNQSVYQYQSINRQNKYNSCYGKDAFWRKKQRQRNWNRSYDHYRKSLYSTEQKANLIIEKWIRFSKIKRGWIKDFNKIIAKYVTSLNFFFNKVFLLLTKNIPKYRPNIFRHDKTINDVKFSADGRMIISSSDDTTVRIWDIASGQQIQTFNGHSEFINCAEFSPDGITIVSCSWDKTIRLWNRISGCEIQKLGGHLGTIYGVTFSPDGKNIASCSSDKTIKLWDVQSGKVIQQLIGHFSIVFNVQFSPDGQMIISSSADDTICLWDVKSGNKLKELKGHSNYIRCIHFSSDGKFIVSGSHDRTIRIWDVGTGKEVMTLEGHLDMVRGVKYFPDGQNIMSCSRDRTIRLWDVKTGQEIQQLKGHVGSITGIDISPDGNIVEYNVIEIFHYNASTFLKIYFIELNFHQKKNPIGSSCIFCFFKYLHILLIYFGCVLIYLNLFHITKRIEKNLTSTFFEDCLCLIIEKFINNI